MTKGIWAASLLATISVPLGCIGIAAQAKRPDLIEIDGKKNPELIPEYAVWRYSFQVLAQAVESGSEVILGTLDLSKDDLDVLLAEVAKQKERDDSCAAKQYRTIEALRESKAKQSAINERIIEVVIGCRFEVLEASDRVMLKLTDRGRFVLSRWVAERKSALRVFVMKDEMAYFNKPR
jgi:hypothetical protein